MKSQSQVFLNEEADNWYRRNKTALATLSPDIEWLTNALTPHQSRINEILEIGCSNGAKLQHLCSTLNAKGKGIDPSAQAVNDGNNALKSTAVELSVGTAASLPYKSHTFDLVFFGFCFYLLDRQDLLTAIAEADRVLKPGGMLAITDFDPHNAHKRAYHHKDGVYSYKQDYSQIYLSSGLYHCVSKHSYSHRQSYFDEDSNERVACALLFKETTPY